MRRFSVCTRGLTYCGQHTMSAPTSTSGTPNWSTNASSGLGLGVTMRMKAVKEACPTAHLSLIDNPNEGMPRQWKPALRSPSARKW
eukprot:scaffold4873_cov208-Pinguiococcus_pyrenoidosus.AAC.2